MAGPRVCHHCAARRNKSDSDPIVWGNTIRRPIAVVNLCRFDNNGVRVLVESSTLDATGIKRFQVADRNGNRKTKYVARVKRTDDSKGVSAPTSSAFAEVGPSSNTLRGSRGQGNLAPGHPLTPRGLCSRKLLRFRFHSSTQSRDTQTRSGISVP